MPTHSSTLTAKGQITLPVALRRAWALESGDAVEFFTDHRGRVLVRPRNAKPTSFYAALPARPRLPEVVDDDDAIGRAATERNVVATRRNAAE
jgi:antitoxin PrlF